MPEGEYIRFATTGEWGFPSGTVFVKHFERGGQRLETQLLVRDASGGVYGVAYQWRADQTDAELVHESKRENGWYYPGPDDCRKCHLPTVGVLGVNTRQLNRAGPSSTENLLLAWSRLGLFDRTICEADVDHLPRLPRRDEPGHSAEERARAYLDANCGYCHRPGGAAADFDARYDTPLARQMLIDAPARINLGIDHARQVAPSDPWRSMVLTRLTTLEQTKMPPLGHETIDEYGAALLREWINSLSGPRIVPPPRIDPKGCDRRVPILVTVSHPDAGAAIRYSLDGAVPHESSPLYTGPIRLAESATVRARAFKPGHTRSIVVQETFIIGD